MIACALSCGLALISDRADRSGRTRRRDTDRGKIGTERKQTIAVALLEWLNGVSPKVLH
jgi:hypothetical protein